MLWNAAPFRMRHRGITAISAGAKNEQWLALEAVGFTRSASTGLYALYSADG
jgi:hypothetical protein